MVNEELHNLLMDVADGQEAAFRKLFDLYRSNIYTTALRITHDEWMAEDIVQDTFIKVWLKRQEVSSLDNFEAWLYVVARNVTFNLLKKGEHYKLFSEEEVRNAVLRVYPPSGLSCSR